MGAADSKSRSVSYGLDEQDNVTVIHGVKLSGDVLQRMRESGPSSSSSSSSPGAESAKPAPGTLFLLLSSAALGYTSQSHLCDMLIFQGPSRSAAETQEELRRRFEREQALVQEELARISRREREMAGDDMNPAGLRETAKTRQELDKTHNLNAEFYRQTAHMYEQQALEAEATVKPRQVSPVCSELQLQVLSCYRLNPQQTLRCSQLAKDYINCINTSKKNLLVNHG
ncbi:coiled-coil-helix-coiled-coil-helix domain containing 6b isoform X5 [Cyprinus carpio]|uniref:Coiled-coil-helix-coiled-coil-helix domain containing 6b isoform X5 n=1 Tax=Cyprinus carpio TaxID=7962 RepID=A0A9Q9WD87_CYPCA|nr:coiled-coil-helix-coiled-coil-helix domain containing 6b isoform X5 [Cyprinus carpio]